MKSSLANIDLLDLVLFNSGTSQEQQAFMNSFYEAMSGYLANKFENQFSDTDKLAYEKIIKNTNSSSDEIIKFIEKHIPNGMQALTDETLNFKRMYLLEVYKNYLQAARDQKKQFLIEQFSKILQLAQQDKWDLIASLIKGLR